MKKLALVIGLLAASASPARAGIYYDLQQSASSATWRLAGIAKWFATNVSGSPTIQLDGVTGNVNASSGTFTATGNNTFSVQTSSGINVSAGGVWATFFKASSKFYGDLVGNVTGNVTGNADTATALAANPSNCSAGNYPLGIAANGAVESCTAAGIGDAVLASTQTFTGGNTFTNAVTFNSAVYGAYVEVASATVSAVTSYTFGSSVITSSAAYHLEYELVQNTSAGDFRIYVNGLTASYRWVTRQECDSTAAAQDLSTSDSAIQTNVDGFELFPARGFMGSFDIRQLEYPTGRLIVQHQGSVADNVVICENRGTGTLATMAGLSSITVETTAGTMTGKLKLYRRWDK